MLSVASQPRQSETEGRVTNYSRIGAYRTCTCGGNDFPCELCAQNSGDMSRIIKVNRLCNDFPSVNTLLNVNKGDIIYGIILIQLACCSFRCTL